MNSTITASYDLHPEGMNEKRPSLKRLFPKVDPDRARRSQRAAKRFDGRRSSSYCLLTILPLALLAACSEKKEGTAAAEKPKEEESRVHRGTNGETIIKLDAETQKLMGLQTAVLESAEISKEIKAYGRVLDPSPLASLTAELTTVQTASAASQAELQRLKTLASQSNASARALEAAQAAAARDTAQAESARLRLLASWGTAIADRQDLPAFVQSLGKLDAALIQLNLFPDQTVKESPSAARVFTATTETNPAEAKFLSIAPSVDPQLQGQALFFLVSPNPSRLAPGEAVTGLIALASEKQAGIALPRDGIVRHNGASWVYVQSSADEFFRAEVRLDTPLTKGWFIPSGLKPGDKVVTAGAQQLLSEEAKQ